VNHFVAHDTLQFIRSAFGSIGKVGVVSDPVKRKYSSPSRQAQAERTRSAILRAARDLFLERGYVATGITQIANAAGVSVDTVYNSVGRKPQLMLNVIDQVLGSSDRPLPAQERDYVKAVRAAATAEEKLRTYANALGVLMPEVSPLFSALREAAVSDPECAALSEHISQRRATNMRMLAADLRGTGQLRTDLSDDQVADIIWSINAPEWYSLVTSRGWTPEQYSESVLDLWRRVLLMPT
jgi:AcrR family transcriptional regulator